MKATIAIESHLAERQKFEERLQKIVTPVVDLQRATRPSLSWHQAIHRRISKLPPEFNDAVILLAKRDWFYDLEMPIRYLRKLSSSLKNGSVHEVEASLIQYFEEHLDRIEASIVSGFPDRAELIREAFETHRRCKYGISIPVFFAQADGICKEITGQHFFLKKDKNPLTAAYLKRFAPGGSGVAFFSPYGERLPISESESSRSPDFTGLNRHMVLHGESLNYGTKANSLKSISLINFVAQTPRFDDEE